MPSHAEVYVCTCAQIQEFMLDLVPETTKGPSEGRNAEHMARVLSIVYNGTELTLVDIQRALAASKPSDEVRRRPSHLQHACERRMVGSTE